MKKELICVVIVAVLMASGCVIFQPQEKPKLDNRELCSNFIINGARYEDKGLPILYLQASSYSGIKLTLDIKLKYPNRVENRHEMAVMEPMELYSIIPVFDVEDDLEKVTVTSKECPIFDSLYKWHIVGLNETNESSEPKVDGLHEIISL